MLGKTLLPKFEKLSSLFLGCFAHLPAVCVPSLWSMHLAGRKQQLHPPPNKFHCIPCDRFIWKHYKNSAYYGHHVCTNSHVSQSHLCYFIYFFKIIHEEGIIKQHYKGNSLQKLNLRE